jgi:6,7-dimethyl-8-ribityllumazine synthase
MSEPYDRTRWEHEGEAGEQSPETSSPTVGAEDVDEARENVFDGWPSSEDVGSYAARVPDDPDPVPVASAEDVLPEPDPDQTAFAWRPDEEAARDSGEPEAPELPEPAVDEPGPEPEPAAVALADPEPEGENEAEAEVGPEPVGLVAPEAVSHEHAPDELAVPPGYGVLEGVPDGRRRAVGVVVARFNGEITGKLLAGALEELEKAGVAQDAVTVMPVPGAFELPIGAMALARTRRFACVVALGCVIRGETPHFDYVASEAASGLQLAALETGVPVAFGVLTLDREDQAEARVGKGAEAVRTALEMADLFSHLRAAAAR